MGEAIWKVVSSKAADATPSQWTISAIILAGVCGSLKRMLLSTLL